MIRIRSMLHADLCKFMSFWILLNMRNISKLLDNVVKCGRPRQTTGDCNRCRKCAICMRDNVGNNTLIIFNGNNGYSNSTQCYVTRALPVLLIMCVYKQDYHDVVRTKNCGRNSDVTVNIRVSHTRLISRHVSKCTTQRLFVNERTKLVRV